MKIKFLLSILLLISTTSFADYDEVEALLGKGRKYIVKKYEYGDLSTERHIFTFPAGITSLSTEQIAKVKEVAAKYSSDVSKMTVGGHASTLGTSKSATPIADPT